MRTLAVFAAALLAAGGLQAQRRAGGGAISGFGNVVFPGSGGVPGGRGLSGFGNVVFPGAGRLPLNKLPNFAHPFSITDPGFAKGLSGVVSGRVPFGGKGFGRGGGFAGQQPYIVPYAYPMYGGGMDPYGAQQPQVTVVYPPPQPPVVINQTFGAQGQPVMQEAPAEEGAGDVSDISVYQAPSRSAEEMAAAVPSAPYYLIALKDHSIYSAVAYWIDGDTLHYFTSGNVHNRVSMALVDRELTERLNRERKVDVRLPK